MNLFTTGHLIAAIIPFLIAADLKSHDLKEATLSVNPVDQGLAKWYQDYTEQEHLLQMDPTRFKTSISPYLPMTRALARLRYGRMHRGSEAEAPAEITEALLKDPENPPFEPLSSYVIDDLISHPSTKSQDAKQLKTLLRKVKDQSCPQRILLMRDIEDYRKPSTTSDAKALLKRIDSFRSAKFQEDALEALISIIPPKSRADVKADLSKMIPRYPRILGEKAWVNDGLPPAESPNKVLEEPFISFEKANREARFDSRCSAVRSFLLQGISRDKKKRGIEEAEATAKRLEACLRIKGSTAKQRFWADLAGPLNEAYGFPGLEITLRSRGIALWAEDHFEATRATFHDILNQARKNGARDIEARTLYTLARIDENEGKAEAAIASYKDFIEAFPAHENYEAAMMSLILLDVLTHNFLDAKKHVTELIAVCTKRPDDKNDSSLAFALFWGGRISLQLGNKDEAQELWRRVASEYFSTFYGAVGHFMLEKLIEKPLVLEPTRSRDFIEDEMYAEFDPKGRATLDRIKALLTLGLNDEAHCELSELGKTDGDAKGLVKAMYLYATGDWLEAIKRYGNLGRSFRNTLPAGMERVLFPRAYTESVLHYSGKLGVDPDYIMSIIRQESVFNPKARSAVGATGLMQLMPNTAKLEAGLLRTDYVSGDSKRAIIRDINLKGQLFDADTNLALGVHHVHRLMKRYNNPVLVLAAYNANPKAADRWFQRLSNEDPLLFIENIPYKETRAYVKLVLRNYFYYKRWYGNPRDKMPHFDSLAAKIGLASPEGDPFLQNLNITR